MASNSSRVEAGVQAHLRLPVVAHGLTVLPANAPVLGVVTQAKLFLSDRGEPLRPKAGALPGCATPRPDRRKALHYRRFSAKLARWAAGVRAACCSAILTVASFVTTRASRGRGLRVAGRARHDRHARRTRSWSPSRRVPEQTARTTRSYLERATEAELNTRRWTISDPGQTRLLRPANVIIAHRHAHLQLPGTSAGDVPQHREAERNPRPGLFAGLRRFHLRHVRACQRRQGGS